MEKKLAKSFVNKMPEINIQLFTPQSLYKYNHKGEKIPGFDSLTEAQQDSALYTNSRYIRYIDDSIYLDKYINSLIDELRALGFKVYLDNSTDSFLRQKPQSYVLNLAQVQLDEYLYPLEDEEPYSDSIYYRVFYLNALDASSWFELNKLNAAKPVKTVLYSSFTSTDGFKGRFYVDPFTMNPQYKYNIDSLTVKDAYDLAGFLGKKHASYLYDFFLNQYILYHLPEDVEMEDYYHFNRFRHTVSPTEDDRFEILDNK
ncbi:MAG: hypothetical protein Q8867_09460 [Bacteroidota bacterium]|nr:hypothetical protein [Bacteroidota bacterium]